jgi:hypothetical protein
MRNRIYNSFQGFLLGLMLTQALIVCAQHIKLTPHAQPGTYAEALAAVRRIILGQ